MDDGELRERVRLVPLELLDSYQYPAEATPIIRGSALQAFESTATDPNDPVYAPIWQLMDAVDSHIPTPERDLDRPFLMSVEDVFSIKGRGTVVTGRVDRGVPKKGEEIEIIGLRDESMKTVVTGIEMFHQELDQAQAGDNAGVLLRGETREEV